MQEPAQRFILNMSTNSKGVEMPKGHISDPRGEEFYSGHYLGERVDVVLGQDQVIKGGWVIAVKFSEGHHVHYDILYVTHEDDDGTRNFQKLYHVPNALICRREAINPSERLDMSKIAENLRGM